jgi:hypothetical protein
MLARASRAPRARLPVPKFCRHSAQMRSVNMHPHWSASPRSARYLLHLGMQHTNEGMCESPARCAKSETMRLHAAGCAGPACTKTPAAPTVPRSEQASLESYARTGDPNQHKRNMRATRLRTAHVGQWFFHLRAPAVFYPSV